jgi:hypothetical protein
MPLFVCATLVSSTSLWTRGKGPMASLGGCRAQHAAFLRRIRDVQRGSPPQADAEGLGVSPNSLIFPKNGGQWVDDYRLERGPGGFRGHDRAWPSEERSGFPLPVFTRTSSAGMTEERRRALPARVWGAHRSKSFPQDGTPASGGMCRGAVRLRRMPRVWS